jgi:hypothetical protein
MDKSERHMNHINANDQPDVVKQFLLSLDIDDGGSVVECDGKLIHVSQVPQDPEFLASIQRAYDRRSQGRPLDEVAADIRSEFGFQQPK